MKLLYLIINKLTYLVCLIIIYTIIGCFQKEMIPQKLCDLDLIKLIEGEQAIQDVNKLHGKKILIKDAWVANYSGENLNQAVIWISQSFDTKESIEQTEIMMKKIKNNPQSPFHNLEVKYISNRKIYLFSGMNQQHAVFQNREKVFWISASKGVLNEILKYYLRM